MPANNEHRTTCWHFSMRAIRGRRQFLTGLADRGERLGTSSGRPGPHRGRLTRFPRFDLAQKAKERTINDY